MQWLQQLSSRMADSDSVAGQLVQLACMLRRRVAVCAPHVVQPKEHVSSVDGRHVWSRHFCSVSLSASPVKSSLP